MPLSSESKHALMLLLQMGALFTAMGCVLGLVLAMDKLAEADAEGPPVCDIWWLVPQYSVPLAVGVYFLGLLLWWVRLQRRFRSSAGVDEYCREFTAALEQHAAVATLYSELLSLLVVADPLRSGEKAKIATSLHAALSSSPPAKEDGKPLPLACDTKQFSDDAVERFAHKQFEQLVFGADARVPLARLASPLREVMEALKAEYGYDEDDENDVDDDVGAGEDEEFALGAPRRRGVMNSTPAQKKEPTQLFSLTRMVIDWRSDASTEFSYWAALAAEMGVHFSKAALDGLRKASENGVGVFDEGGFVSLLLPAVYAKGFSCFDTMWGSDGCGLVFFRSQDHARILSVLQRLESVAPDKCRADRSHWYNDGMDVTFCGWRLLKPGEPFQRNDVEPTVSPSGQESLLERALGNKWLSPAVLFAPFLAAVGGTVCAFRALPTRVQLGVKQCTAAPVGLLLLHVLGLLLLVHLPVTLLCLNRWGPRVRRERQRAAHLADFAQPRAVRRHSFAP